MLKNSYQKIGIISPGFNAAGVVMIHHPGVEFFIGHPRDPFQQPVQLL